MAHTPKKLLQKSSQKSLIFTGITGVVIILIATTLIRMFTLDTEIALIQTVEMPTLPVLTEMKAGDFRQKSIALDGRVIQGTSLDSQPTASTAKMILSLAVMEKYPFDLGSGGETIEITQEFYDKYLWYISHNGSNTPVVVGEEISQYDALASVLLASSNNMADSLAIWAFGSLENYQKSATDFLARIGVNNTTIGVDACGYSETTTSTAEDLAVIANKLLENPVLKEIVGLKSYIVPVAGLIKNTNAILGEELNSGASVIGIKTGYIGSISGYNLISAYQMDDHYITLSLLGATTRTASFKESEAELLRLSSELTPTTIVEKDQKVGYYQTWWSGQHDILASETLRVIGYSDERNQIELKEYGPTESEARASNVTLSTRINGIDYSTPTAHEDFPSKPTFWQRFLRLFGWEAD